MVSEPLIGKSGGENIKEIVSATNYNKSQLVKRYFISEMDKNMSDKPWFVNVKDNAMIYMSNMEYLNHLLETSRNISPENKTVIKYLIWDLEAIKDEQHAFYTKFSYKIKNEINNLKRIMKLELYPRNRKTEEGSSGNNGSRKN